MDILQAENGIDKFDIKNQRIYIPLEAPREMSVSPNRIEKKQRSSVDMFNLQIKPQLKISDSPKPQNRKEFHERPDERIRRVSVPVYEKLRWQN
jgi:hypothetical protein